MWNLRMVTPPRFELEHKILQALHSVSNASFGAPILNG